MRKTIFLIAASRNVPSDFSANVAKLASMLGATPGYEVIQGAATSFLLTKPDLIVLVLDHTHSDSEVSSVLCNLTQLEKKPPILGVLSTGASGPCELIQTVESQGGEVRPYQELAHDVLCHIQAKFSALAEAA